MHARKVRTGHITFAELPVCLQESELSELPNQTQFQKLPNTWRIQGICSDEQDDQRTKNCYRWRQISSTLD